MTVFWKALPISCLLLLPAVDISGAQAVTPQDTARSAERNRSGTWSARTGTGVPLQGTWTAVADSTGRSVVGTWTLVDTQGRTLAQGGWSAAKARGEWSGGWRAVVVGKDREYAGTWTAGADLEGDARFSDLFERAVRGMVSGKWRAGPYSGPWAIRALEQQRRP